MILSLSMVNDEIIEIETKADTLIEFGVWLANGPAFMVMERAYSKGSTAKRVLINRNHVVSAEKAD